MNLAQHLKRHPELNLADVAYTLQVGRRGFEYRRMLLCQKREDLMTSLQSSDQRAAGNVGVELRHRSVAFMFSGQGAQYVNMGRDLYESESTFRNEVDLCCQTLTSHLGCDLRTLLYPDEGHQQEASRCLQQTAVAQPALFVIELALARLWMSWGIIPQALIGHSIGEYVAACLAGVFSVDDALTLVAQRGRPCRTCPPARCLPCPCPRTA